MTTDAGYLEEGDSCEKCRTGKMDWARQEGCSCHINPPCWACTNQILTCQDCGWEYEPPPVKYAQLAPGLAMRESPPRPLDNTKIDWRSKMHSNSSMIKEGVYPDGTTRAQVEDKVRGTFGGRFESFGNGKFRYIAYTD